MKSIVASGSTVNESRRCPTFRDRGFTLTEILVVIAIIAVVSSLTFAALASAKRASLMSASMSNMRQSYVALSLYMPDGGTWQKDMPAKEKAQELLGDRITYDPADYWRKSAGEKSPYEAMIGSYAYANADLCDTAGGVCPCTKILIKQPIPVLLSIFYDPVKYKPSEYTFLPENAGKRAEVDAPMPSRVLTLWSDGHVKFETVPASQQSGHPNFSWGPLLQLLDWEIKSN